MTTTGPTDEELQQARLNHAAGVLNAWVMNFVTSRNGHIRDNDLDEIVQAVKLHTRECRNVGVPFPDMVVILLPRCGHIALGRKDWGRDDVQNFIVTIATNLHDKFDPAEMADAVAKAWPDYARGLTFGRAH